MVFHWSLSDSKSPPVSGTLLSILAVLKNVVVWTVSTRPPSSKSSRPFSHTIVTVPNAPITIGIIVTFMFHSFFHFPSKVEVLILLIYILLVLFCGQPEQQILQVFFFLLNNIRSGLLAVIRWSVWTGAGLCIYHFFVWSNLNFLHISQ